MKFTTLICCLLVSGSVFASEHSVHPRIVVDYAREYLMKQGLGECVSSWTSNEEVKNLFRHAGIYYGHRSMHDRDYKNINNRIIFAEEIKPFFHQFQKGTKENLDDVNKIGQCLDTYHSDEYRAIIYANDKNIDPSHLKPSKFQVEIDMEPKSIPYTMLTGEARKVGDWGMYRCLSNVLSDSKIKHALLQKSNEIKRSLPYGDSAYRELDQAYSRAVQKYKITFGEKPNDYIAQLGCFIIYDTNSLNDKILKSFR